MSKLFRWRKRNDTTAPEECACPHAGCCASTVNAYPVGGPTLGGHGYVAPLVVRGDDPRGFTITFPPTAPADRERAAQLIQEAVVRHAQHGTKP